MLAAPVSQNLQTNEEIYPQVSQVISYEPNIFSSSAGYDIF